MPKTRLPLVWEEEGRRKTPDRSGTMRSGAFLGFEYSRTPTKRWTILTNVILELVAKKATK